MARKCAASATISRRRSRSAGTTIAQGRRDQSNIDGDRFVVTHSTDLGFLQHPQQLGLQRQRQLTNLIEEQGATVGVFEQPDLVANGVGEGSAAMTEQLRLEQRRWQRGAVDRHKSAVASRRGHVNRARHQLLAGTALTEDQHGGAVNRHARDGVPHRRHRRTFADQREPRRGGRSRRWIARPCFDAAQRQLQRGLVHRLAHHIGGAGIEGGKRRRQLAGRDDRDERRAPVVLLHRCGQRRRRDDRPAIALAEPADRSIDLRKRRDVVAAMIEDHVDGATVLVIRAEQEDAPAFGSVTVPTLCAGISHVEKIVARRVHRTEDLRAGAREGRPGQAACRQEWARPTSHGSYPGPSPYHSLRS
jgi:hypothetical protein